MKTIDITLSSWDKDPGQAPQHKSGRLVGNENTAVLSREYKLGGRDRKFKDEFKLSDAENLPLIVEALQIQGICLEDVREVRWNYRELPTVRIFFNVSGWPTSSEMDELRDKNRDVYDTFEEKKDRYFSFMTLERLEGLKENQKDLYQPYRVPTE